MDRAEFKKRIENILSWDSYFNQKEILTALLDSDATALTDMRSKKSACDTEITRLLNAFDNASTPEEKQKVIGSVKRI